MFISNFLFAELSVIPVQHDAGKRIQVRLIDIDGNNCSDLIMDVAPDPSDPLDKVTIYLSETISGRIQVLTEDIIQPDSSVDAHGLLRKLGGGTANFLRADGAWSAPPGTAVFGTQWNYNEDLDESSTSSSTWVQKVRLSVTDLPEGDYLIMFGMIAYASSTNVVIGMRIEEDDTTVLCSTIIRPNTSDAEVPCMQFARLESYSGDHTLDLEFNRTSIGQGTAYVKQARIALYRVA